MDDFKILDDLIGKFGKFVTTPNILTEVSNLGAQLNDNVKKKCFGFLAQFFVMRTSTRISVRYVFLRDTDIRELHIPLSKKPGREQSRSG